MDEFYIVRLWVFGVYWDMGFYSTRDAAEVGLNRSIEERRKRTTEKDDALSDAHHKIHRMVRIDQITDEIYVEVSDSEVVECDICGLIVKFKGRWTNFASEPPYHGSGDKYCGQCYERMAEIKRLRNEANNNR